MINNVWFQKKEAAALTKRTFSAGVGLMEVRSQLDGAGLNLRQDELRDNARDSTIRTFGWPIGVFLDRQEYSPKSENDGIEATVNITSDRESFDYWSWSKDGKFFLKKTIFEDERDSSSIFFDTRIIRITEVLMYLKNFYERAHCAKTDRIEISIRHSGIKNRTLRAASRSRFLLGNYQCETEDETEFTQTITLSSLDNEKEVIEIVKNFVDPFFILFNFFKLDGSVLAQIVSAYRAGKIV